jgi:hypothetical protein
MRDVKWSQMPIRNRQDQVEDVGVLSAMALFTRLGFPVFAVPRREDYGLDLIVQVAEDEIALPASLEERSTYVRRYMGPWLRDERQPARRRVTGAFLGIQLKTSKKFQSDQSNWSFVAEERHCTYWSNCPFPVMLVGCDASTGELRWSAVTDVLRANAALRTFSLFEPLNDHAVHKMTRDVVNQLIADRSMDWLLHLGSNDASLQYAAVVACWLWLEEPRVIRLLAGRLPQLSIDARREGLALLLALYRRQVFRSAADGSYGDDDPDFESWLEERGYLELFNLPVSALSHFMEMWTDGVIELPEMEGVAAPGGVFVIVPPEPWDRDERIPDGAVGQGAWQVRSGIGAATPRDNLFDLLALQSDWLPTLAKLSTAVTLVNPHDGTTAREMTNASAWANVVMAVAVRVHHIPGPQAQRTLFLRVLNALLEANPQFARDASFTSLYEEWS